VVNVHKDRVTTGMVGMIGETGTALKDFTGKGKISIHGEIWNALAKEDISKDDEVVVVAVHGMTLEVQKKEA